MILTGSEIGHLNSMDWQEIAALYDIHAPLSAGRSKEPLADASTGPYAPAPGLGEELDVFEGDWQVPTQLRSTFAPLHRGHLGEGDAVDTPGASSSTSRPSDEDVTARVIRLFPTPPTLSLVLDPVPAVVTRRVSRVTRFRGQ